MKLFLDSAGKIEYEQASSAATVQDLLDAVDAFLAEHPLPCGDCKDSCCKKPWAVEVDIVAAHRIAGNDEAALSCFVRERLTPKWNHALGFRQYVLRKDGPCRFVSEENRCAIYGIRPVICRLYVCAPIGEQYGALREVVAATYLQALVYEQNMREKELSARTVRKYRRNPAMGAVDYSLPICEVIEYGRWMGW